MSNMSTRISNRRHLHNAAMSAHDAGQPYNISDIDFRRVAKGTELRAAAYFARYGKHEPTEEQKRQRSDEALMFIIRNGEQLPNGNYQLPA